LAGKKDVAKTPARDNLFNLGTRAKLDTKRSSGIFHTFVAKRDYSFARGQGPLFSKQSWCYAEESKGSESSRLGKADESNEVFEWHQEQKLIPERQNDLRVVKWCVDESFTVHLDFKSHTGTVMTLGKGAMQSIARNQKMKRGSSTQGELATQ
jgi:hypothetical protein